MRLKVALRTLRCSSCDEVFGSYAQEVEDIETVDSDARDEDSYFAGAPMIDQDDMDDADLGVRDDDDTVLEEGRRLLAEAESKLASVERALARLDAGSYGLCEICNEPIAPNRLTERPSLARCEQHEVDTA